MSKSTCLRFCLAKIFVIVLKIQMGFCYVDNYEAAPYSVIKTFPQGIEERSYPLRKWAVIEDLDASITTRANQLFLSLFSYIAGNNVQGQILNMTVPVATKITEKELGNETEFEMGFFIPEAFQNKPPAPEEEMDGSGLRIKIVDRGFQALTITYNGTNMESEFKSKLDELLHYLRDNDNQFNKPTTEGTNTAIRQINPPHYFVSFGRPGKLSKNEVWIPLESVTHT